MGTLQYWAPEVLLQKDYSFGVDLWSFAIVYYLMIIGKLPYETHGEEIESEISLGHVQIEHQNFDQKQTSFLKSICTDQSNRLTVEQCIKDTMFN